MVRKEKKAAPLPFPIYFWTIFALAVAGVADSIYLSISHYRVYTDIGYRSFCAISKSINCDTVSQSPYSIFLGLPVPVWGIFGYAFFLLFLPLARNRDAQKKRIWTILFLLVLVFSIYSAILALISSFIIHSYCIMCIVIYAISFLLFFYTHMIRNRFNSEPMFNALKLDLRFLADKRTYAFSVFTPFLLGIILIKIFLPTYWNLQQPILSSQISSGITDDGHPWIGAERPELTITGFTDYQCFQCKKMHYFLIQLIRQYPEKIRLVHRHFPMDHEFNPLVKEPFHVGSGKMALLAISSVKDNKFWQMNDALFEAAGKNQNIIIRELAQKVGTDFNQLAGGMKDRTNWNRLQNDIISGLKLEITGTPAFVIDGKVYFGQIPPEIIKNAIER
jgi:uncharacterized membrane protein/protein-disulfide isomerase